MSRLMIGIALSAFAAVMLGGCATAPWAEEPGDICDFEFPFVNDYDIVNKTTFRWDDSYVTNNPTTGFGSSAAGTRTSCSIRTAATSRGSPGSGTSSGS